MVPEKDAEGEDKWVELGIPTMAALAAAYLPNSGAEAPAEALSEEEALYLQDIGIDVSAIEYRTNLERLMDVLHAQSFILTRTGKEDPLKTVNGIISKIQRYIIRRCLEGRFAEGNRTVLDVYRAFYRKLVYRDRNLPRPWVFTTNYDLFSERALDGLGISFCNGFSGVIERMFNPASFKYALAEQLDVSSRKWTAVDNHVYLCKLHGSINWIEDAGSGIHGIREVQTPSPDLAGGVMIFPTPLKHHATIASPYTDLFREFQARIVREQTVLVTLGYSFGDSHIDAIIHQALTVPTFRLVVFGDPNQPGIRKLIELNDPRIWVIAGEGPAGRRVHYFEHVVDRFLPDLPGERIDESVRLVVDLIRKGLGTAPSGGER
ncbi:MAG: hypothetical protein VR70_11175 [Rhodospirillaceae bacterium BRH_c57]|nr:MAG: hypothetical protein VR70_11175 [Rhodospirillaceae bacterium BRH_c57]